MSAQSATLVYFSPTGTSRKTLEAIAGALEIETGRTIDLTRPENRSTLSDLTFDSGPVLLAAPVYAGRLPAEAAQCFSQLQGQGAPAVLVVLYGNREYEDALVELRDIAADQGFVPMAAAAFIGEHSFSSDSLPIAQGRPDELDLEKAREFGATTAQMLKFLPHPVPALKVPGNTPYKEGMGAAGVAFIQVTQDCDGCGACLDACPEHAIDPDQQYATLPGDCIFCCACIKVCPTAARVMMDGPFMDKARWLNENCSLRKEPEFFFAEG